MKHPVRVASAGVAIFLASVWGFTLADWMVAGTWAEFPTFVTGVVFGMVGLGLVVTSFADIVTNDFSNRTR